MSFLKGLRPKSKSLAINYSGTADMNGNVGEWNDAVISGSSRGRRGGSWGNFVNYLASSDRYDGDPSSEGTYIGFRVASGPEPSALFLTMLAGSVMLIRRKR
jgi:formylglycine-generating enzyme required for sulfatase activity